MLTNLLEFLNSGTNEAKASLVIIKIILILIIGLLVKNLVTKYVYRYLDKKDSQQSKTIKSVVGSLIKYFTYFIMITAILSLFGENFSSILAVAGIGSVAIGFGAQTFVRDVITGSFILMEEQFQIDDIVMIEGFTGRVESIGIRTTTLRNITNNEVYIIPNGEIKIVTNKTKDFQKISIPFKLKYHEDLEYVRTVVSKVVEPYRKDKRLLSEIVVSVNADSTEPVINVNVVCSVSNDAAYTLKNDLTNDLSKAFFDEGLEIAVSQRLVYYNK